jgi:hypothetical protein
VVTKACSERGKQVTTLSSPFELVSDLHSVSLSRLSSYRNLVRGWIKQHSRVKRSLIFRNFILSIIWELDGWTIESPSLHKNIMGTRNEFDDSVERDGDIRGLCSLQSCVEGEDDAKNTLWPVGNKSRDERSELT